MQRINCRTNLHTYEICSDKDATSFLSTNVLNISHRIVSSVRMPPRQISVTFALRRNLASTDLAFSKFGLNIDKLGQGSAIFSVLLSNWLNYDENAMTWPRLILS